MYVKIKFKIYETLIKKNSNPSTVHISNTKTKKEISYILITGNAVAKCRCIAATHWCRGTQSPAVRELCNLQVDRVIVGRQSKRQNKKNRNKRTTRSTVCFDSDNERHNLDTMIISSHSQTAHSKILFCKLVRRDSVVPFFSKAVRIDRHSTMERGTSPWRCLYNRCLDRKPRVDAICIFVHNCNLHYNDRYEVFFSIQWSKLLTRNRWYFVKVKKHLRANFLVDSLFEMLGVYNSPDFSRAISGPVRSHHFNSRLASVRSMRVVILGKKTKWID